MQRFAGRNPITKTCASSLAMPHRFPGLSVLGTFLAIVTTDMRVHYTTTHRLDIPIPSQCVQWWGRFQSSLQTVYSALPAWGCFQTRLLKMGVARPQSTHRVAIADFWRISHHDGKISPGWRGWGCTPSRPPPLSLLPSRTKLQCTLLLRGQIHSLYFISIH
jgi:hypothetical protein